MFSGRRQRGTTAGEALEALNLRREANRQAEAKALALAVAKSTTLRPALKLNSTSESRGQLGPRSYRRTSFRKINVTYKRPLPPFPVCTFEDNNVKIVISDIYDRYEIPKSELNQGTSHHRYEYLDEEDSRGK